MSRYPKDAAAMGAARNDCGKIAYDARWKAKKVEREGRKVGRDHMSPYLCAGCGLWHLGHSQRLKRTTPIRPRSKKTARVYRQERVPLVAELLEERPWCEIRFDENCTGRAAEVDEIKGRGRGGSILDRANLQTSCHHCHAMKTANPVEAERRGLSLRSWEKPA